MDDEFGLALRETALDVPPGAQKDDWSGLPPELLEIIGSKLTEGAHLRSAATVCKSWNASIATGLSSLEVDMHSDPGAWRAKTAALPSLIRRLRSCVIHVNTAALSAELLAQNIALVQQLRGVEELKLHLRDGCDLPPAAAAALGSLSHLTSLSLVGGTLSREAAAALLAALAATAAGTPPAIPPAKAAAGSDVAAASTAAGPSAGAASYAAAPACGAGTGAGGVGAAGGSSRAGGRGGGSGSAVRGLRRLTLLPTVPYGLGDEEMAVLAQVSSLEVLEFRACRLTSTGLAALSLGLSVLSRLAITSLDSDSGYELACLERLSALAELDLALDQAPTAAASRRALCAVRPGRSLSLSFRWTDRAQGLLTEYGSRLANLTHLDVGACRVGSESLFEAVAQLTGLRQLRMAVYSNADHCIPCHLSRLAALEGLQKFRLEKRRAYFPEARRFGESSITVPITSEGLRCLAGRWTHLRALRLALSRRDYSTEALTVLSSFTGLQELGLVVERYPGGPSSSGAGGSSSNSPSAASTSTSHPNAPTDAAEGGAGHTTPRRGSSSTGSPPLSSSPGSVRACLGRLSRLRGVVAGAGGDPLLLLPPTLDLSCLPPGLRSLELNNLLLDLSIAAAATATTAVTTATTTFAAGEGELPVATPAAAFPPPPAAVAMPLPLPPPAPLLLPLSQLSSLDVEGCVVRPPLLARLAARCGPALRNLRLVGAVGLSDSALADCWGWLPALRALTVSAPGNRAVTQAGLAALSSGGRRPPLLRQLTWESDDLTARGPDLAVLAPLTSLRHLHLSCTDKTAERALGGSLKVLQDALPYCHVDMVWTATAHPDPL